MSAANSQRAKKSDEIKWMEKVFAAEIENRLPFQTKAAIMERMEAGGLVEPMKVRMSGCTVEGWQLTHRGRIQYCEWASANTTETV